MIHFCKAEQTHGHHGPARYAYAINPLLDRDTDCVLDVEATPARFAAGGCGDPGAGLTRQHQAGH